MLEKTEKMAFGYLRKTLGKTPLCTRTTVAELCQRCDELDMDDCGGYQIVGRELFDDPIDLDRMRMLLLDDAEVSGYVVEELPDDSFVIRERIAPADEIHVRDIVSFELDIFAFMDIGRSISITIQDGAIACHHAPEAPAMRFIDDEMAERLDGLFATCGIAAWKPLWRADNCVADGEAWSLNILLKDGRALECNGDDDWPMTFENLIDGIEEIVAGIR
ncbi:MAG: hypothetical protein IJH87_02050 [Atopobiaceae bacterium]|nr:hypothetical protein [Atopobiaceae bacterium]